MALQFQAYMILVAIGVVFAPIYIIACFVSCFKAFSDRKRIIQHNFELRLAKEDRQKNGGVGVVGKARHTKKPNIQFVVDEDRQRKWGIEPSASKTKLDKSGHNGDSHCNAASQAENQKHNNEDPTRDIPVQNGRNGQKPDVVHVMVEQHQPLANGGDQRNNRKLSSDNSADSRDGVEMDTFNIDEHASPRLIASSRRSPSPAPTTPVLSVRAIGTAHDTATSVEEPLALHQTLGSCSDAPLQLPKTSTSSSRLSDSEAELSPNLALSRSHTSFTHITPGSQEYLEHKHSPVMVTTSANGTDSKHKYVSSRENVTLSPQERGRQKRMAKSASMSKDKNPSVPRDLEKRSHSAHSTTVDRSATPDVNVHKPERSRNCKHNKTASDPRRSSPSSVTSSKTSSRSNIHSHCDNCSLSDIRDGGKRASDSRERRARRSSSRQSSRDSVKDDAQQLTCFDVEAEHSSPSPQGNVNSAFVNSNDETTPTVLQQQQFVSF